MIQSFNQSWEIPEIFAELLGESSKFVYACKKIAIYIECRRGDNVMVVSYSEDPVGKSSFSMPTLTTNGGYHEKQVLECLKYHLMQFLFLKNQVKLKILIAKFLVKLSLIL